MYMRDLYQRNARNQFYLNTNIFGTLKDLVFWDIFEVFAFTILFQIWMFLIKLFKMSNNKVSRIFLVLLQEIDIFPHLNVQEISKYNKVSSFLKFFTWQMYWNWIYYGFFHTFVWNLPKLFFEISCLCFVSIGFS